jgi:hypothetical protein
MILENFWGRIGESSIVTLAFMLGGFLIWSVAAYAAADRSGDSLDGVVAGLWSATTSVLLAVTFGLILMTAGIPAAAYVETWQEFKNSGWTNARAFGIANSLDAVFGHFIAGPIFGLVCGVLGAGMTAVVRRRR